MFNLLEKPPCCLYFLCVVRQGVIQYARKHTRAEQSAPVTRIHSSALSLGFWSTRYVRGRAGNEQVSGHSLCPWAVVSIGRHITEYWYKVQCRSNPVTEQGKPRGFEPLICSEKVPNRALNIDSEYFWVLDRSLLLSEVRRRRAATVRCPGTHDRLISWALPSVPAPSAHLPFSVR